MRPPCFWRRTVIYAQINGVKLEFETSPELFSPSGIDRGTAAMLETVGVAESDVVLDLGCGYGVVGIYCAKIVGSENVTMCDISTEAVRVSRLNAQKNCVFPKIIESDGFNALLNEKYTLILSNPPYHTDFAVAKSFIEGGFRHLEIGGRMVMVTKRREWYENKLRSVFGGVRVNECDGYFVFISEKRGSSPHEKVKNRRAMSRKLRKKFEK